MKRLVCFISIIFITFSLYAITEQEYKNKINDCLAYTQKHIMDVTADGQVNCVDYAITFKTMWDMQSDTWSEKCNCEIVYNGHGDFDHLFIRVHHYTVGWECIEPQALPYTWYYMEDVWGTEYNPVFNQYGQTEYWLSKVR